MSVEEIYKNFIKICGSKFVSDDPEVLESFSKDLSFVEGKVPSFIVWPRKTKQVEFPSVQAPLFIIMEIQFHKRVILLL